MENNTLDNLKTEFKAVYHAYRSTYSDNNKVHESIRYLLDAPGKWIRPMLCLITTKALGGVIDDALPSALSIELIHTYSLVHDDLPCMDDDNYRRGRKTIHAEFDEATAVLAGDALLTDSFGLLSNQNNSLTADRKLRQISMLAKAVGSSGMVAGQSLDMEYSSNQKFTMEILETIHKSKTGKLIGACFGIAGITAGLNELDCQELYSAGVSIGLSFQILDDLLDNSPSTGKTSGKDAQSQKLTYLSIMSREEAKQRATASTEEALKIISNHTSNFEVRNFLLNLLERKS